MAYSVECLVVRVRVSFREPEAMFLRCRSCRSWSGGPVNAFTLWKPDAKIAAGAEHVGVGPKTPVSERVTR